MNKKTILSAIGVVVLGALGSGVWELVKPLLGWSWSVLLTIATLGLDSLRDGIYADTASSLGKPIGLGLAAQALTGLIFVTGALVILYIRTSFRPQPTATAQLCIYFLLFMAMAVAVASIRTKYIGDLSSHYARLETIVAPYLSDIELKRLRAEYVQVRGRSRYVEHIRKLEKLIRDNGGSAPTREFF